MSSTIATHGTMPVEAVPDWLDREEYPFRSRFFDTPHGRMHYIDEGEGETILFLHGNPTWSFEHRKLLAHLSKNYRCIAPDHLGFGLSAKPDDCSYLPQFHAENLQRFIDALGLDAITLVLHDWGGPIGMAYALDQPKKTRRLIVYNTWCWSVRGVTTLERFSGFVGGPIGRFLCKYANLFPRVLLPASVGNKHDLSSLVRRHFIAPFPTPRSRKGTWVFPGAIIGQSAWLDTLWKRRVALRDTPTLFLWGLKDNAFPAPFLARWEEAFPDHTTHTYPLIGHFTPEELGDEAIVPVETFLAAHPLAAAVR